MMPRLPTALDLATATPQAGRSVPSYSVSPIGQALSGFGNVVARIGKEGLDRANERALQDEKFGAATRFLEFENNWRQTAKDRAENAAPGAPGFVDAIRKDYVTSARQFFQSVPDDLKSEYDMKLAGLEGDLTDGADSFYRAERTRYAKEQIDNGQNTLLDRQANAPRTWWDVRREGEGLIENSGLSPIDRDAELQKWRKRQAEALFDVENAADPESARSRLGIAPVDAKNAASVIRHFEGYSGAAYWDVNAYRAGFGSDTVTLADGTIVPVTKDTVVTQGDAERDLVRRTQEFANTASTQVGAVAWDELPTEARSALTSVAYNYGSLPESVVAAVRSGDTERIASSVEKLSANPRRRAEEAAIIRGAQAGPSPEYSDLSYEDRVKMFDRSAAEELSQQRAAFSQETQLAKEKREEITKSGYDMMLADDLAPPGTPKRLTMDWVEANRDVLNTSDYKAFLKQFEPDTQAKRTPPKEYIRLLDLAESDPEQAQEEVRKLYADDIIAKDVFNTVMSRARDNERKTGGRNFASELRSYISTSLTPERDAPQWQYARKLDALFQFDDFLDKSQNTDRETLRKQAQSIIDDYRKIRYQQGATSLPMPRYTQSTPGTLDLLELQKAMAKTTLNLQANKIDERQAAEQAAIIRRWMDIIRLRGQSQ